MSFQCGLQGTTIGTGTDIRPLEFDQDGVLAFADALEADDEDATADHNWRYNEEITVQARGSQTGRG